MTRINLLPWREAQRKERKREFVSILGGAAFLMLAIIGYVHFHVSGMIDYQKSRNSFLEKEIAEVDKKIKEIKDLEAQKKQLLNRMNVIQELQTRRPMVVHMMDQLARSIPDGVYLTKIGQKNQNLTLEGMAQSNARVSAFMRNLDSSNWFSNPKLNVIQVAQQDNTRASKFTLNVKQLTPDEMEAKAKAKAEKAGEADKGK
jgi:type IV pilus assembly protein PilN